MGLAGGVLTELSRRVKRAMRLGALAFFLGRLAI